MPFMASWVPNTPLVMGSCGYYAGPEAHVKQYSHVEGAFEGVLDRRNA